MGTAESKQEFRKEICRMVWAAVVVGLFVIIVLIYMLHLFVKWFSSLLYWKELLIGIVILMILSPNIVKYLNILILKMHRMYRLNQMINTGKYDDKTKRIIIPIKPTVASNIDSFGNIIYNELPYCDVIEAKYCSSTTFKRLALNALSVINNHKRDKKYILWDDNINNSITSKDVIDIIDNGLEIKLMESNLYDLETVSIKVNIKDSTPKFQTDHIRIKAKYTESVTIGHVMEDVMDKINETAFPTSYILAYPHILTTQITEYRSGIKSLIFEGINIKIVNGYRHRIANARRTCTYLKNNKGNALKCPIYKAMLKDEQYTENNLDHLDNYIHFKNAYNEQELCKHGQLCESHIRLQNKSNTLFDRCHSKIYRHPPRTERQIKLSGTFAFIVNHNKENNINAHCPKQETQSRRESRKPFKPTPTYVQRLDEKLPKNNLGQRVNAAVTLLAVGVPLAVADVMVTPFRATYDAMRKAGHIMRCGVVDAPHEWLRQKGDKVKYGYNEIDGFLSALMKEVIKNGYKCDLCLKCKKDDLEEKSTWFCKGKCKHDVMKSNGDTLLSVLDKKLEHNRHKAIGKPLKRDNMLALLLYTGGDCNYALCSSQRSGDYKTWKWFDYCLFEAIWILNEKETGNYNLYSGLRNVKMDKKERLNAYFVTYVSSSWDKSVAESFIRGNLMDNAKGMLLEMDSSIRSDKNVVCCDVSWISKFETESEVLIARSIGGRNCVSLKVVDDDVNGVQIVSVKQSIETK